MTNYYYSSNPDVEHKEKKWNFELLGNNIHFTTDNGVFSKNTVDFGTRVLLETIDANLYLDNKKNTRYGLRLWSYWIVNSKSISK